MESVAIILFYFLVWRLEPYTIEFFSGVSGVKERLIQKRVPEPVVSSLFFLSAALALVGILSTLVLLPGMSVNNILSVTELKQLSHFFLAIGVILITQYFIMRYIHGNTSRDLLARFSQGKAACLFHQIELTGQTGRSSLAPQTRMQRPLPCAGPQNSCSNRRSTRSIKRHCSVRFRSIS